MRTFTNKYVSELSLRKPQPTSLGRATSFNLTTVKSFFSNLKAAHKKYEPLPAEKINNLDESGLTTIQDPLNVYAKKRQKQVYYLCWMRTAGYHYNCNICAEKPHSTFHDFPRLHFKDRMIKVAPLGSLGCANPSRWSNDNNFQHFFSSFWRKYGASYFG